MKKIMFIYLQLLCLSLVFSQSADSKFSNRHILGRSFAENLVDTILTENSINLTKTYELINNEKTAVSIAELILNNIYGKKVIQNEKPFEVYKIEKYWIIFGTLPKGYVGGVFKIVINSYSGEIIHVSHDK